MIKEGVWYNQAKDELLVVEKRKINYWLMPLTKNIFDVSYNIYDRVGDYRNVTLKNTKPHMVWVGEL